MIILDTILQRSTLAMTVAKFLSAGVSVWFGTRRAACVQQILYYYEYYLPVTLATGALRNG